MKTTVAFFFGCRSVEHEVSIISAVQAMNSVNRDKYDIVPVYVAKNGEMYSGEKLFEIKNYKDIPALLKAVNKVNFESQNGTVYMISGGVFSKKRTPVDVAFPVVHGTNCEDGSIQGYFEFLGLPYVGCDVLSSAVGMDKVVFKDVLKRQGLAVLDCYTFYAREFALNQDEICKNCIEKVGLPLIVKPVNLGSSVGISKVNTEDELFEALNLASSFADKILVEKAITSLREINCSVLGDSEECFASVCEEPFMNDEILSYEDKYLGGGKGKTGGSKGMASLSRKVPADLTEEESNYIRNFACDIFKTLGCSGVVRIDFMIDKDTNTVYANEINTIPGSLAFYLWEATGTPYKELLDKMISLAFKRDRARKDLTFTIDTNILASVNLKGAKGSKGSKA